jgi:hypothetical protein
MIPTYVYMWRCDTYDNYIENRKIAEVTDLSIETKDTV